MIKALRKDQALIDDILQHEGSNDLHCWWLGQSGFLVQYLEKRLLLDPYLSDSLTLKYASTDKPHERISELVINPILFPRIDLITSSHNHTDHLDAATLKPILENSPACKLIIPEANRDFVSDRLQIDKTLPIGLNDGETYQDETFKVTAIPAAHNNIDRNEAGQCHYLGYFITVGGIRIYHSGDTLYYSEMEKLIRDFAPHVALLPINGNVASRKVAGNLNAEEAVDLAKSCNIPYVIPCHYDLFAFNTADVNEFIKLAKAKQQGYVVLHLGGKWSGKELGIDQ
ncbi:MAG: MBL fold metallo-hydrolase [Chitinophagaceae bacterium]|jgi:L-ascorbate metabolism protein UlaG (beta-lactamase superfamily)